jgi:hypothetical protein
MLPAVRGSIATLFVVGGIAQQGEQAQNVAVL